eukprot:1160876-Pelagomonas_calceolata.AAC.4
MGAYHQAAKQHPGADLSTRKDHTHTERWPSIHSGWVPITSSQAAPRSGSEYEEGSYTHREVAIYPLRTGAYHQAASSTQERI